MGFTRRLFAKSYVRNTSTYEPFTDPFSVPRDHWAFHTAYENGEFIQFYKSLVAEEPIDAILDYVNSDYILDKKRRYLKYRLNWMMSQRPEGRGTLKSISILSNASMAALTKREDSSSRFSPSASIHGIMSKIIVAALILLIA